MGRTAAYKNQRLILFLLSTLTWALAGCVFPAHGESAQGGQVSLGDWQETSYSPLTLHGTWTAAPLQQDETPTESAFQEIPVPNRPREHHFQGYPGYIGTRYRLDITDLPPGPENSVLALLLGRVHGAYTVEINGQMLYTSGESRNYGAAGGYTEPSQHPNRISTSRGSTLLEFPYPDGDGMRLIIDVFDTYQGFGGISGPVLLGFTSDVTSIALRSMAGDILNLASMMVLGLFLVGFFLVRPIEDSTVFLGFFALLSAFNHGISGHQGLTHVFGALDSGLVERLSAASFVLAMYCFFEYTRRQILRLELRHMRILLRWITGLILIVILLLPESQVWMTIVPFLLVTMGYSIAAVQLVVPKLRDRTPGVLTFLICFILLQAAGGGFILQWFYGIDVGTLPSSLTVLSVFIQALYLGREFSTGFSQAEGLNHRLKQLLRQQDKVQENLERTVISRTADLRAALDAAKAASTAKGNFLANMSHEIRTPLNGILGFCELLQYEPGGREAPHYIRLIRSESLRLLEIINQLLDISKIEAGKLELEINPFDIHEMLQVVSSNIRIQARNKGLYFTISVDEQLPRYLVGDSLRLRQILDNLLSNAVKFTEEGSISLGVEYLSQDQGAGMLRIVVEDTGIGIPLERQAQIFDAFEQADPSTTRMYGGTGLGTAIALKLARMMDGNIRLTSTPGRGSRFEATLALRELTTSDFIPLTESSPQTEPRWNSGPHVLLVEDYELNRILTRKHLESAGWQVSGVSHGQEALDFVRSASVDCIIMDIQMPVLDGYQATEELRAQGFGPPIIGLSANVFPEDQARALAAGMNTILSKPLGRHTLLHYMAKFVPPGSYIQTSHRPPGGAEFHILHSSPGILDDLDGDLGSYLMLVREFASSAADLLKEMDEAMENRDLTVLHRAAHTIKGGALNIGAALISETALRIENKARQGGLEAVQKSLQELQHQIGEISNYFSPGM